MKGLLYFQPQQLASSRLLAPSGSWAGGPGKRGPSYSSTPREMKGRVMMDGGEGFQSSHVILGNVTPSMEAATMSQLQDDCLMG